MSLLAGFAECLKISADTLLRFLWAHSTGLMSPHLKRNRFLLPILQLMHLQIEKSSQPGRR